MTVSVVIPTVPGRERHLARAVAAYAATTEQLELLVLTGYPACGYAWEDGLQRVTGDYIHLAADDLEPHPGWWQAAANVCDQGFLPAPLILNPDRTVQSSGGTWAGLEPDGHATEFTRAPFLSRQQAQTVRPMLPAHYYTDNWVSWRGRQHGIQTVNCHAYLLTHHTAAQGRGAGMTEPERMSHDYAVYIDYQARYTP